MSPNQKVSSPKSNIISDIFQEYSKLPKNSNYNNNDNNNINNNINNNNNNNSSSNKNFQISLNSMNSSNKSITYPTNNANNMTNNNNISSPLKNKAEFSSEKNMNLNSSSFLRRFKHRNTIWENSNTNLLGSLINKSPRTPAVAVKMRNNVFLGFCYPIVEAVDTREFNMKRLKSIDLNDLKAKLHEAKNVYKKLGKEERKNYTQTLIELSNKFREIKERRMSEIKSKGKNLFLFKVANNCLQAPYLNIYSEFSEEEIDVVINCVLNDWDFPPFEYYEKLANSAKTQLDGAEKGKIDWNSATAKKESGISFLLPKEAEKSKIDDGVHFHTSAPVINGNILFVCLFSV